jgi:hypothetical protein
MDPSVEGNLFEFEGPDLVAGLDVRRSRGRVRVTVTFATPSGHRRVRFDNPEPLDQVFPLLDAEQVWVYLLPPGVEERARVRVEFYVGDFHSFAADAVLDLDPDAYDTKPGVKLEPADPD